ncbi:protein far1-related sequence 11 [Quercus suber]|uniref:Protein FAR1-RELATED SEQUENCE n=1 Tax=Quercus suber TaxID=58331 RepID=A0AAW0LSM3_QUESU
MRLTPPRQFPTLSHCCSDQTQVLNPKIQSSVEERMSEGTSIVMESSENGTDLSQDDIGTIEETPDNTILSRQTSVNLLKPSEDGKMQRNRKSSRCGCQAYLRIVKRADFDLPEWRVTGFSNIHNHELLKPQQVRLLPAYCTISPDDKSRICMFAKAGMSVRQMLRLLELEKGVKLGCLPFTEIDVRNLLQSFRNVDRDSDAIDLIAMCKKLKDENPNFKYDFKIDCHNRLEHIAWSYASSVQLYEAFGDAVVFDTTHRLDAYDMLLGIWLGVDNHGMTCFFGCVLLQDENMHSFSWTLKKVSLKTGSPIESHAATLLTPYAFSKLQEELVLAPQYASLLVDEGCFQVRHHTQIDGGCNVIWIPCQEHISCSCHQFEFSGILCRHVLRVLSTNNCFHIPDRYLPTRWRSVNSSCSNPFRTATTREHSERIQLLESMASTLVTESIETEERLDVACEQMAMVLSRIKDLSRSTHCMNEIAYNCPSDSLILPEVEDADGIVQSFTIGNPHDNITLGKLKERRPREGIDTIRKRRHCTGPCCGHFGHDGSACSLMGDDDLHGDALGYL